jgi:hypothetical protein
MNVQITRNTTMLKPDVEVVQRFLDAYDESFGTVYGKNVIWLDEDKQLAKEERVEAIADDPQRGSLAIEHTLVEPFTGERRRIKGPLGAVFELLQADPSLLLREYYILLQADVDAVPSGADWNLTRGAVKSWLFGATSTLRSGSSEHIVPCPGFGLPLRVTKIHYGKGFEGQVHVTYEGAPDTFDDVVRERLRRKVGKLVHATQQDGTLVDYRVLMLELNCREKGYFGEIQRVLKALSPEFPDLHKIEEIWAVDTSEITAQFNRWIYARLWPNLSDIEAVLFAQW